MNAPASPQAELRADIAFHVPDGCPGHDELVHRIETLTAAEVVERRGAAGYEITIARQGAGYTMSIVGPAAPEHEQAQHSRQIEDPDCRVLVDAAALMIAVGTVPVAVALATAPQLPPSTRADTTSPPARTSTPASAVATPQTPSVEPDIRQRRSPRPRAVFGALGGASVGMLPNVAGIVAGFVGVGLGRTRLELSVDHAFASREAIGPSVELFADATHGGLTAAFALDTPRVAIALGTGVRIGVLRAVGVGPRVDGRRTQDASVTVPAVGMVEWPRAGRIALAGLVEVALAARRPGFAVTNPNGPDFTYRRGLASLGALVGPVVRLP